MSTRGKTAAQRHKKLLTGFRVFRIPINLIVLILYVGAFTQLGYPLPGSEAILKAYSGLDPLIAAESLINNGLASKWLPGCILLLAGTALLGRFFCAWLCPLGSLLAIIDEIKSAIMRIGRPRARIAHRPEAVAVFLNEYRYAVFIGLLAVFLAGSSWPLFLAPSSLLGHELEQILSGSFPVTLGLVIVLGLIVFPRFWCTYLCPSGLLFQLAGRFRPFGMKFTDRCNSCGLCVPACPVAAIDLTTSTISEACNLCGSCMDQCRRKGMGFGRLKRSEAADFMPGRRGLIQMAAGGLLGLPVILGLKPGTSQAPGFLRPPGALPEAAFIDTCLRCHRCIKACPTGTLRPLGMNQGFRIMDTPILNPNLARCELEMLCAEVCPANAIQLIEKSAVRIGQAVIARDKCLNWRDGKLCLLCLEQCPMHAILKDGRRRPHVDSGLCVGCGSCEYGCPASPKAVTVFLRADRA